MFRVSPVIGRILVSIALFLSSVSAVSFNDTWLQQLMRESTGQRVTINDVELVRNSLFSAAVYKVSFSFQYRLPKGDANVGVGSLYIPHKLKRKRDLQFPLHFQAGYSQKEAENIKLARTGVVVANPERVTINPLAVGPNRDLAMLHIVRNLPFIDDSRVGIDGGSAGGFVALLLAARTFPLSYVHTTGAVLNRGYNLNYLKRSVEIAENPAAELPVVNTTAHVVQQALNLFSNDLSDEAWYYSSPISQLDTITAPVALKVSSADTLVPIEQVSRDLTMPVDPRQFPPGFTSRLEDLAGNALENVSLLEILNPQQVQVLRVYPPDDLPVFEQMEFELADNPPTDFTKMPFSKTKQWTIVVREEGPKLPKIGHIKYLTFYLPHDFNAYYREARFRPEQLTVRKLERLMSRYAGKNWQQNRFVAVDYPDVEQLDVLRGLVTYSKNPEAAARFLDLYKQLPADKQLLDESILTYRAGAIHKRLRSLYNKHLQLHIRGAR